MRKRRAFGTRFLDTPGITGVQRRDISTCSTLNKGYSTARLNSEGVFSFFGPISLSSAPCLYIFSTAAFIAASREIGCKVKESQLICVFLGLRVSSKVTPGTLLKKQRKDPIEHLALTLVAISSRPTWPTLAPPVSASDPIPEPDRGPRHQLRGPEPALEVHRAEIGLWIASEQLQNSN